MLNWTGHTEQSAELQRFEHVHVQPVSLTTPVTLVAWSKQSSAMVHSRLQFGAAYPGLHPRQSLEALYCFGHTEQFAPLHLFRQRQLQFGRSPEKEMEWLEQSLGVHMAVQLG